MIEQLNRNINSEGQSALLYGGYSTVSIDRDRLFADRDRLHDFKYDSVAFNRIMLK